MKMIINGILILLLLIPVILLWRNFYVNRKLRRFASQKYKVFEPLIQKLALDEGITGDEILTMAKDPSLRHTLFGVLREYGRESLFPTEYFNHEKGAESLLVNWLEFPTELGIAPSEIELMTKVTLDDREGLDYYVFKYRTMPPHWAARDNWMMGVSGPYHKESIPYDTPPRIFSRFNAVGSLSPESEVRWVHEHIGR